MTAVRKTWFDALNKTELHSNVLHWTVLQHTLLHSSYTYISPTGQNVGRFVCHDYGRPRWVSVSARDPGGAELTDGSSTEQAEMTQDYSS